MSDDPLLAALMAQLQQAAPPANTGAPANVRAAVGAAQTPEDRLATLRRFAPDAQPYGEGNFTFTDPRTRQRTIYNPRGFDWNDVVSVAPEVGEFVGGAFGGALALPPAIAGVPATAGASLLAVPAGVGLGAAAGREVVTGMAALGGQTQDTRSIGRRVMDAGTTAGLNAAGVPLGGLVARGVQAVAGPVARAFGARTGPAALSDFANAGVTPSAGAATGNRTTQLLEQGLTALPGGVQPMKALAERQAAEMGDEARRVGGLYGTASDPTTVGGVVRRGATEAVARFEARQEDLYSTAFGMVGADTPAALPAVARLGQTIERELANAPASRERVLRPVLDRIAALTEDGTAGLPFEALRQVRTDLGRIIGGPPNAAAAPASDTAVYMRQLYGALTDDMTATARQAGPDAARSLATADRYTRFNRTQNLPALEKVLDAGTDQQVFALAFPASGRPDPQTLARLRRNLQPDEWNAVAATVLDRMGTPTAGTRGAGDGFSVSTFLTNWNKLRANGPGATAVLFGGGQNARLVPELDRLTRVAERLRDVEKMANPPGTARTWIAGSGLLAMGAELGQGDLAGAAQIGALGVVAPRYAAKLITDPSFVRWLAGAAAAPSGRASTQALARLGAVAEANPEIRDAIEAYRMTFTAMPPQTPQRQPTPPR